VNRTKEKNNFCFKWKKETDLILFDFVFEIATKIPPSPILIHFIILFKDG